MRRWGSRTICWPRSSRPGPRGRARADSRPPRCRGLSPPPVCSTLYPSQAALPFRCVRSGRLRPRAQAGPPRSRRCADRPRRGCRAWLRIYDRHLGPLVRRGHRTTDRPPRRLAGPGRPVPVARVINVLGIPTPWQSQAVRPPPTVCPFPGPGKRTVAGRGRAAGRSSRRSTLRNRRWPARRLEVRPARLNTRSHVGTTRRAPPSFVSHRS
jgi:hypothetical protein